jgi:hypothetical protein
VACAYEEELSISLFIGFFLEGLEFVMAAFCINRVNLNEIFILIDFFSSSLNSWYVLNVLKC